MLGFFYTPFLLEAALIKYMGSCEMPIGKLKKISTPTKGLHKFKVFEIIEELRGRINLQLSLWMMMAKSWVPEKWRSQRTNQILKLAQKSQRRIFKAFDMRNMIDSQDDLQLFMRQFMTSQQLWLFKRSKRRVVSLNHSLVTERVRGKDFDALKLLGWEAPDEIDK